MGIHIIPLGLSSKVINISRTLTDDSADVATTGVGFQPSALVVFSAILGGVISCEGFSSSDKSAMCIYHYNVGNIWINSLALMVIQPTATYYQVATVKSYDADGFTLTWTKTGSPTGIAQIIIMSIK